MNGRPLTKNSEDVNDLSALTPNHLLLLRAAPMGTLATTDKDDVYSKRWRHVQFLADQFWKNWIKQYLPTLQYRSKWNAVQPNVQVGDIVLLVEKSLPRNAWPLAKVLETYAGRDGLIRSVKLRTASSELVRPITCISLLEGVFYN